MKSAPTSNKYEVQEDHEALGSESAPKSTCSTGLEGTDTSSDQATTRENLYGTLRFDGLTASNLALHRELLRQSESVDSPNQQQPQLHLECGAAASVPGMKTLSASDPDLASRRIAYQQRRENRKEARRQGAIDNTGFLSNVPEVEDDVPFRFNFVVIGGMAHHVVQATCSSASASSTSSKKQLNSASRNRSPRGSSQTVQALRCLCFVTDPMIGKTNSERQKLAKLVFQPVAFGQPIVKVTSRLDALSTAMVFVLAINHPSGDRLSLEEQLAKLAGVLEQSRAETKAKLRPVRAVILCSFQDPNMGHADESWAGQLADFEQLHGDMWKFGPIYTEDGDAFHAAFAEMASVRINRVNLSDTPADSSQLTGRPDDEEVEAMGEDGEDERSLLEQQLVARSARSGRELVRSNSTSSQGSEGWQRPPIFEAECDGSACSEDALEKHVRIFGQADMTSTQQLNEAGGNQDVPDSAPLTSTETSSGCMVF